MDFSYYTVLLIIHILTIVVGLGAVTLNGLYGNEAKNAGANGGNAITRANLRVSTIAEYVIYTIPVTGILMVIDNDAWDWDQTWVWLSIVLYVVALGIAHSVLMPGAKKMVELTAGGPPGPEVDAVGKRLAIGGMTNNLILVALITLMIWKPGL